MLARRNLCAACVWLALVCGGPLLAAAPPQLECSLCGPREEFGIHQISTSQVGGGPLEGAQAGGDKLSLGLWPSPPPPQRRRQKEQRQQVGARVAREQLPHQSKLPAGRGPEVAAAAAPVCAQAEAG